MRDDKQIFIKECALYIKGELSEVKMSGSKKNVELFSKVLSESRKFYLALQEGELKNVLPQLAKKRQASKALREQTGYVWPL